MKNNQTKNLVSKPIWGFDTNDTIYIRTKVRNDGNSSFAYCQFIRMVGNTVYGKVIDRNDLPEWSSEPKVGDEIYADFKKCALFGIGKNESHTHYHWFETTGYAYKDIEYDVTEKTLTHPSYGLVRLSRGGSNATKVLFGSNIQHKNTITLTVNRAENDRMLNDNHYNAKEQIVEIELSGSQFTDLITSFNMGQGVPCTIRRIGAKSYPDPPYENPVDIFQREFESKMKNLGKDCQSTIEDSLKILKDKKTMNNADRDFVYKAMERLIMQISSNVPFVSQQFISTMEQTVTEAKSEIEMFVTNKITTLGIEALKNNPTAFIDGIKTQGEDTKDIDKQ